MTPQLSIITAAMSLGGMASIGFSHYGDVEEQLADYHEKQVVEEQRVEVSQVGDRVEHAVANVAETLRGELEKDRKDMLDRLMGMGAEVEALKAKQSSHDILMERLSQEQTSLGFKIETQAKEFRPLHATGSRFLRVNSGSDSHPLLPPVPEESWTNDY